MSSPSPQEEPAPPPRDSLLTLFLICLRLGLTSFGGPIAHLGYFREEYVRRRRWLSDEGFAELVALCQFLPGPASSQVGFGVGVLRGGLLGGCVAWLGFTLPSAVLMIAVGYGAAFFEGPTAEGIVHGLKVTAVAVVAHAVYGMAGKLCADRLRAGLAVVAAALVCLTGNPWMQIVAIAIGAGVGAWACRPPEVSDTFDLRFGLSRTVGVLCLLAYAVLLAVALLPREWIATVPGAPFALGVYRAGALVFGGGHVVLPLLQAEVVGPGMVTATDFLAGYGAAQAVPGPMFTFGAFLGTVTQTPPNGWLGGIVGLGAIFLPGMLLLVGAIPFYDRIRRQPRVRAALMGVNAAVVGLLGAALYDPVWTSAILSPADFALALAGFVMLQSWRLPAWLVVLILALGGLIL